MTSWSSVFSAARIPDLSSLWECILWPTDLDSCSSCFAFGAWISFFTMASLHLQPGTPPAMIEKRWASSSSVGSEGGGSRACCFLRRIRESLAVWSWARRAQDDGHRVRNAFFSQLLGGGRECGANLHRAQGIHTIRKHFRRTYCRSVDNSRSEQKIPPFRCAAVVLER